MLSFFKRLTLSALLLVPIFSQAQPYVDKIKKDIPNTYSAFGKKSERIESHFIFVIDVTEKEFGPQISAQIQSFVDALPTNNLITVIQLGPTNETLEIVTTTNVTNVLKKDIIDKLKKIEFGKTGSDGLEMAKSVIKAMNAPGTRNAIPFVFIFSDYEFYLRTTQYIIPPDTQWQSLNQEYEKVKAGIERKDNIYISGLRLNNPRQRNDYFDKLRIVFGTIIPETVSGSNLLRALFYNIQARIYRQRLLNYVDELKAIQTNKIELLNKNGSIELAGADTLVYHKLILDDMSKAEVSRILNSDKIFSFMPPGEKEVIVSGMLVAEKYKNELPELSDIQLRGQKIILKEGNSLLPWWLTDLIVLILGLLLIRFIWTLFPVSLHGMITFSSPDNFDAAGFNANCSGKKTVTVGYGQLIANDPNLFGSENFSLRITACRKFFKGKSLELAPLKGDIKSKRGNIVIQKGTKSTVGPNSRWSINGVDIGMPGVK